MCVGGSYSVQSAGEVTVRGSQCRVRPASRREKAEGLALDTPKKECQEIRETIPCSQRCAREGSKADAERFLAVIRKVQDDPNDPGPRGSGHLQAECRKCLLAAAGCFY